MMHTLVGWHVEMEFQEEGDRTRAAAMVRLGDGTEFRAHGTANRHPPIRTNCGSGRRSPAHAR